MNVMNAIGFNGGSSMGSCAGNDTSETSQGCAWWFARVITWGIRPGRH
jgi:hypothetical protein